ncbi:MAG: cytochrome c oxidase assembly protein [Solirubrobacteraceae bacterium]
MLDYLPVGLIWAALVLHLQGERRAAIITGRPRDRRARWRAASFYAGLATILVALLGPIDSLAHKLFWVHMLQHVLLLTVAAPLIVLGAPWMSVWRPLPLGWRRTVARSVARSPVWAPVRAAARALGQPLGAWLAFNLVLVLWHIPAAYDLTLRSSAVHILEHISFLVFGILLWAQVIESPPLRVRLTPARGAYYMTATLVVGWLLSLVLTFAPRPLYPAYSDLAHRPGGISALTDQQLAGGVMLGLGSISMMVFVFIALYRWLGQDQDAECTDRRRATASVPS